MKTAQLSLSLGALGKPPEMIVGGNELSASVADIERNGGRVYMMEVLTPATYRLRIRWLSASEQSDAVNVKNISQINAACYNHPALTER